MSFRALLLAVVASAVLGLAAAHVSARAESSVLQTHPALKIWRRSEAAPSPHALHPLTIALKQRNLQQLESVFWDVSNPKSPKYGQYLTPEEIAEIVAPAEEDIETVRHWLRAHNATNIRTVRTRDVLMAHVPMHLVERMFDVTMVRFDNADGRFLVRSLVPYTLPQHIAPLVDLVKGVNDLPLHRPRRKTIPKLVDTLSADFIHTTYAEAQARMASGDQPTPTVYAARARFTTEVVYTPICQNGFMTHTVPPCTDYPPMVSGVVLTAASTNYVTNSSRSINYTSDISCSVSQDGALLVTCTVVVDPVTTREWLGYYDMSTIGVQSLFSNGAVSAGIGYNQFPVLNVPPVTPQVIAELYKIAPGMAGTHPNSSQCVVEFEQQYYTPSDLSLFQEQMGLPDDTPVNVIGPNDPTNPGVEANLDIQYIMGVGSGINTTFWSIAANSTVEVDDILSWCFAIGNATKPPLVNSLSYGMAAEQVNTYLGPNYLQRSDVEFQKLAVTGITIIIASGDTGAGDLGPPPMSEPTCTYLHPDWPSQSPYITSVSSTIITPAATPICYQNSTMGGIDCSYGPLGEIGVSLEQGVLFTGGGGFSIITSRPAYQNAAVTSFLRYANDRNELPPANMWNRTSRGYPDVSAIGHNCMVANAGTFIPVDGTSASAPIFAGVVALLNDIRLNAKKAPLGFINPFLYNAAVEIPASFYDVTVGSNRCGAYGWSPLCCVEAFHATPGWDAVTGLGTPNFGILAQLALMN